MTKKKLFFLSQNLPYPFDRGIRVRTFNLLRSLSDLFDITIACQVSRKEDLVHADVLKDFCTNVHVSIADNKKNLFLRLYCKIKYLIYRQLLHTPNDLFYANYCGLQKEAQKLLKNSSYDVCFFEYWFWPELLPAAPGIKVVDTNDIQHTLLTELQAIKQKDTPSLSARELERYRLAELGTLAKYDMVLTVTDKDKAILSSKLASDVLTVPTGVDTDYFCPRAENLTDDTVISFYGAMSGSPNVEALLYFYREVFPLVKERVPGSKLLVIGANPAPEVVDIGLRDADVTVTGYVEDVQSVLSKSRVSVCTFLRTYGHRGRILEVMSMGIPVVATRTSVDGMGLTSGVGVIIHDSARDLADAVVDLLTNKQLASRVGQLGREYTCAHYSKHSTYDFLTRYLFDKVTAR